MASRPFQFRDKKHFKIGKSAAKHFEGLAALSIHSAERRAAVKAGCKPVHFSLDGCPLSCYFSESVATTSGHFVHKSERGTKNGAFIYALSAVENRPALAAPRYTSTALFSCRFKCPCPPRRQRHFHGNADRAYNTLHFAPQSRVYFVKCFSQKSERKIPNLRNGIFPYISRKHFHMIVMQSVA